MSQYRKKPVVIDAVRLIPECTTEMVNHIGSKAQIREGFDGNLFMLIPTMEGTLRAEQGDWVIKGIRGEFYPCKPDIFEATYEKVEP